MSNPLKKTMVYLGLADEETGNDAPVSQNAAPVAPVHNLPPRSPVTPLRRASSRGSQQAEMNEILTVHPDQYRDAKVIAESFREGIPVIINLSRMTDDDARRLIDFASGLSEGLYGKIERVTSKVFLLSPSHIAISGDTQTDSDAESTIFVP